MRHRIRFAGIAVILLALIGAACSGDDDAEEQSPTESASSNTGAPTSTDTNTEEADDPTASAETETEPEATETEPEAEETPTPSPTLPESDGLTAALEAASAALGVPTGDACVEGEDCIRPLPDSEANVDGDILRLAYASGGGGGAIIVMARTSGGDWQPWMVTQGTSQLLSIPGQLTVCSDPTAVHDAPDGALVGEVERGTTLDAVAFVLTSPGSQTIQGSGWYQVAGAADGWVSTDSVVAGATTCPGGSGAETEATPRG